jgi:heat shock protein HtpX
MTSFFSSVGQVLLFLNLPLILLGGTGFPWGMILLLLGAPTVSLLLQLALSRTREFEADQGAAELTGDPEGLARALDRMEAQQRGLMQNLFGIGRSPVGSNLLRTHPPTEERIRRLMESGTADSSTPVHSLPRVVQSRPAYSRMMEGRWPPFPIRVR